MQNNKKTLVQSTKITEKSGKKDARWQQNYNIMFKFPSTYPSYPNMKLFKQAEFARVMCAFSLSIFNLLLKCSKENFQLTILCYKIFILTSQNNPMQMVQMLVLHSHNIIGYWLSLNACFPFVFSDSHKLVVVKETVFSFCLINSFCKKYAEPFLECFRHFSIIQFLLRYFKPCS